MIYLSSVSGTGATEADLDGLIEDIAGGDSAAFETLYKQMKASVYGYALSLLKNTQDAEDVVHDCFVKLYFAAASYRKGGKAKAWIMTIARNLCVQRLRDRKRQGVSLSEDQDGEIAYAERVTPEDRIVLEQCMLLLSDQEREIIILHAVSGFKHREIAEMLGIPLSTVLSKYNRGLKKLSVAM